MKPSQQVAGLEADGEASASTEQNEALLKNAVSGSLWTFFSQATRALAILLSTIVIARYVMPKDWGIAETAKPILVFLNLFVGAGMNFAIIQRQKISDEEVNFLFWFNILVSVLLAMALAAFSGPIAAFFSEPALCQIAYALSAGIILNGACSVHHGLLLRHGHYRQLSLAEMISPFFGAAVGIFLAVNGYGYWAIVANTLVTVAVRSVLIIVFSNWKPKRPDIRKAYWDNVIFGGQMLSSTLLSFFSRNSDNLIIAKLLGSTALGFYSLAYRIMIFPFFMVSEPISRVMISSLSRLQDNRESYLQLLSIGLRGLYLLLGFMAVLAGVFAAPLINGLLGAKWSASIELVQILAISIPFQALLKGSMWSMITLGKSAEFFKWSLFSSFGSIAAFLIGTFWGIKGVSIAFVMFTIISAPLSYFFAASVTKIDYRFMAKDLLVPTSLLVFTLGLGLISKTYLGGESYHAWSAISAAAVTSAAFICASAFFYRSELALLIAKFK